VLWFRPGYSKVLDWARRAVRWVRPTALPLASDRGSRDRLFRVPRVARTWAFMALADSIVHYCLIVRWYSAIGHTVLCDRYVEDALIDLRLRFPDLGTDRWLLAKWLRVLAPIPIASIVLTIPHAEMLRRMRLKNEPFPDEVGTRDLRFQAYQEMAADGHSAVRGDGSVEQVHCDIWRVIELRRATM